MPENNAKLILRILDMGAQGIQVPHISGLEDAKRAVAAVRYPPLGERGAAGSTRAAGYGSIAWREHVRTSNEEILLTAMTEDLHGIRDIEAIAALDGIDLISLAPTDLSMAWALPTPATHVCGRPWRNWYRKCVALAKPKSMCRSIMRHFISPPRTWCNSA